MRRSPACRLVSLNVPEASTATYASNPLPTAVIAGKAAQTSSEMPAKISFLRPVDHRTVDDRDARQRFDEFAERRTPHAVARRRGCDNRQFQCFCSSGQGHDVVFQLAGRVVTDACHEADL